MSLLFTVLERNNHTLRGTLLGFLILWNFDRLVICFCGFMYYGLSTSGISTWGILT